jgi:hypothetical protein
MIKLDRFETHDRFKSFTKQNGDIGECCQDLINQRPFGNHAFYIFAHARTDDMGSGKRIIWQPRLTRPLVQTNSMLFKGYVGSDIIKIIWIIPARELWEQYKKGNITANEQIWNDIQTFEYNRKDFDKPEDDDLNDEQVNAIYKELSQQAKNKKMMDTLWMPKNSNLLKNQASEIIQMQKY